MARRPLIMLESFRSAARALVAVTVVALVADAILGTLTASLGALSGGGGAPWWVVGRVPERSRWVVFAVLLLPVVRAVASGAATGSRLSAGVVWQIVGRLSIVLPLLWIIALWIVQATIFTAAGRWDVDGQIYLSGDYYRRLFAGYAPWLLAGAAALVGSRHVS